MRDRKGEEIAKCSHCLSTLKGASATYPLALVFGSFLFHLHSQALSFVAKVRIITCQCSEMLHVQWLQLAVAWGSTVKKPHRIRAARFPALCGGLCSYCVTAIKYCMHKQFNSQLVPREPVRRRADMATLLVCQCVRMGVSPAPVISWVCQMELKNISLLCAWVSASRHTRPR